MPRSTLMEKNIIPVCNTTLSGEYTAQFYSINLKQRINDFGRISNFYNFIMVDDQGFPLWNPLCSDWCFAAIQSNVPKKGKYRHAKVHRLPRILTPRQFMNFKIDDSTYEFPSMEKLLKIAKENQLSWKVRVQFKQLTTSTFSKITHILNPRSNEWEPTDGAVREQNVYSDEDTQWEEEKPLKSFWDYKGDELSNLSKAELKEILDKEFGTS